MTNKRKWSGIISILVAVFITLSFTGCGMDKNKDTQQSDFIKGETDETIVYMDPLGNEVTLKKNPERVVFMYASFLDLWYYTGGEAIASVKSSSGFPEGAEDVENLGSMSKVSPEKIISLQPDLIVLSSSMNSQVAMKDILEENNIPYLYLQYNLYQDFLDIMDLMSRIAGTEEVFKEKVENIKVQVNDIVSEVKGKEGPKVLIMFATTKSLSCEVASGITGNMVEMLGGKNIVEDTVIEGETRVDFSPEIIVQKDPDIIFVKTMGDVEKCKVKMKEDIESNEMWAGLRAVKEGKYYYLPKDMFMSKPNGRFPEAFEMLKNYMYEK